MNQFQQRCIESINSFLKNNEVEELQLEEIAGKKETYLVAKKVKEGKNYKIYIYEDELGLDVNGKWYICEKPGFRSQQELIDGFLSLLSKKMLSTEDLSKEEVSHVHQSRVRLAIIVLIIGLVVWILKYFK